ncbi:MAG: YgeY family selenium metabolism-linked hydrolase [Anaerolineae bacterium]|nr:YgeY family selenium metabolism-linked hydrolase [Thermoflexales bacterium]MDW8407568.1 YgeY family selenium metabolism-linked hydrolase [Anaerolineae bacterium]
MTLDAFRKQQIVEVARDLVRAKSLAGREAAAAQVVINAMRALNYDEVRVDALGNVIGLLKPTAPTSITDSILFDSHLDTVEAAGRWTKDPFGGEVGEGKLWGRGAADMKGALAASLCGAAYAKADGRLRSAVLVSASVNEEQIEGLALADVLMEYRPTHVVICESTALRLNIGGRGRAEVFLTVEGVPAHASTPHLGVNALKQAARLILALNAWQPPHDPDLGYGIFEPTEIISSPYPSVSVLPDRCRIRCDRRLLVGETERDVLDPLNETIDRLRAQDETFRARAEIDTETITTYTGAQRTGLKFQPAWKMNPEHDLIRAARTALNDPPIGYYAFCTNAARSAGMLGIPTIGFGPGCEEHAHIADEFCELEQLWGAAQGYYALCSL